MSASPLVTRLISSSVAIANQAGKIIRDVMAKGELAIVEKEVYILYYTTILLYYYTNILPLQGSLPQTWKTLTPTFTHIHSNRKMLIYIYTCRFGIIL